MACGWLILFGRFIWNLNNFKEASCVLNCCIQAATQLFNNCTLKMEWNQNLNMIYFPCSSELNDEEPRTSTTLCHLRKQMQFWKRSYDAYKLNSSRSRVANKEDGHFKGCFLFCFHNKLQQVLRSIWATTNQQQPHVEYIWSTLAAWIRLWSV